jgi:carbon-monoxide dehydrogenase medium subunit
MIPDQFDYVRPAGLHDALKILSEREGEAKVLSGGYSLLPLIKLRLAQPGLLVDIRDIDGLDGIVESDDALRIGARATHRSILEHPIVRAGYPLLTDAAGGIGDPQVRNWGTIGGSCAHADPSSDWPAVLLATRATLVCRSSTAERTIAAGDFFIDTFQTASGDRAANRDPHPGWAAGSSAYAKLERRTGDFRPLGCAAMVTIGSDGRIADADRADRSRRHAVRFVEARRRLIASSHPRPRSAPPVPLQPAGQPANVPTARSHISGRWSRDDRRALRSAVERALGRR